MRLTVPQILLVFVNSRSSLKDHLRQQTIRLKITLQTKVACLEEYRAPEIQTLPLWRAFSNLWHLGLIPPPDLVMAHLVKMKI